MNDLPLNQTIILDTNIIQYSANNRFGTQVKDYLNELAQKNFKLAISDISYSELLANLSETKEKDGIILLKSFRNFVVDQRVLGAAARVFTIYNKQLQLEERSKTDASTEDRIIAATTILTDSLIMTSNINDFPRPFFSEVEEKLIFYKESHKTGMLVIQLLKPNIQIINQRFSERPGN